MTKIILVDNKSIHIEGYKHIVIMDESVVRLKCGKRILNIEGSNLAIETLCNMELNIYGIIEKVAWMDKNSLDT